jgi:hypothetical protein
MATDIPSAPTDVQLLHEYLGKAIAGDQSGMTLDEALTGFQEYYRQLRDLRSKVRQAEDSLARGEGRLLDVDGIIARVRRRLAEQGVAE